MDGLIPLLVWRPDGASATVWFPTTVGAPHRFMPETTVGRITRSQQAFSYPHLQTTREAFVAISIRPLGLPMRRGSIRQKVLSSCGERRHGTSTPLRRCSEHRRT